MPRNFPRAFPRIRTWNSRFIRLFLALLQKIPLISDWSITWRTKSVPSLHPHYKDFKATTNWSAPVLCIGTLAWQGYCFQLLPFHHNDRFSRSIRKPVSRSRHLHAGCHSVSKFLWIYPDISRLCRFWHQFRAYDTSSVVHFHSSPYDTYLTHLLCLFPQRSPQQLLIIAAWGDLKSMLAHRIWRAYLHLSYSFFSFGYTKFSSWHTRESPRF